MFVSIVDLITLCILLAISPAVKDASTLLARGDKRDVAVLHVSCIISQACIKCMYVCRVFKLVIFNLPGLLIHDGTFLRPPTSQFMFS